MLHVLVQKDQSVITVAIESGTEFWYQSACSGELALWLHWRCWHWQILAGQGSSGQVVDHVAREGHENLLMSSSTRSEEAASRNVGLSLCDPCRPSVTVWRPVHTSPPPHLSRLWQSDAGGRGRLHQSHTG